MKVKTVGLLAAVGMMLTSVTVWSLTAPSAPTLDPDPGPLVVAGPNDARPFAGAHFTAGKTLMVEGRLGNARLPASQDNETFVMVDVRGADSTSATTSAQLNLAIVIDRSGSMKGKRLSNAVAAAQGMIRRLRDGDVVSVTTYNTETQTVVASTTIDDSSRERAIAALRDISAQGDTCISCGIDAGMAMLRQRSGMVDRVLLLSDGEATAGVRDVDGFRRIGDSVRRMGASVSTVGVDVDFNERVMTTLAQESNGQHYFVEDPSGLSRVFDDELASLVRTVAKDSEVSLELAPGVELVKVFDRSFRRDGDRIVVPMGTFAAGESKTLLAQVRIPRGATGERPIADVRVGYDDTTTRGHGECNGNLTALLVGDASQASPTDAVVQGRIDRSETASTLQQANDLFAQGQAGAAKEKIASQRLAVAHRARSAVEAAPAPRKAEVKKDFDRQVAALDEASAGFATPPPAGAGAPAAEPAAPSHASKAQVRRNAANAFDFEQ